MIWIHCSINICIDDLMTQIQTGKHNSTYTVSSIREGKEFKKTRHNHPVKNAKASYQKVNEFNSIYSDILWKLSVDDLKPICFEVYIYNMYFFALRYIHVHYIYLYFLISDYGLPWLPWNYSQHSYRREFYISQDTSGVRKQYLVWKRDKSR